LGTRYRLLRSNMKIYLETERLILREILPTDIDGMFELDANPEVHKYLGNNTIKTKQEAADIIKFIREQYNERGIGRFATIEKSSGDFIGWSGLKYNTGEKEALNNKRDFYDIGYRFIPRFWGKGYATESALAVLDYGFKKLNIETICGAAEIDNIASNIILKKIGLQYINEFSLEGVKASWYELKKEDYVILKRKKSQKEYAKKYYKKYYKKNKAKILKRQNKKYKEDFGFRENVKAYNKIHAKNRYHEDETYRKKTMERVLNNRK